MKPKIEALHAQRLLEMFEDKTGKTIGRCPVLSDTDISCDDCFGFLGIIIKDKDNHACPCTELGQKNAVKRTWIALEEKGYI